MATINAVISCDKALYDRRVRYMSRSRYEDFRNILKALQRTLVAMIVANKPPRRLAGRSHLQSIIVEYDAEIRRWCIVAIVDHDPKPRGVNFMSRATQKFTGGLVVWNEPMIWPKARRATRAVRSCAGLVWTEIQPRFDSRAYVESVYTGVVSAIPRFAVWFHFAKNLIGP